MRKRVLATRTKVWLYSLYPIAKGNAIYAAELAGYRKPHIAGPKLRRRFWDLVQAERLQWREHVSIGPEEALRILGRVCKDYGHKDQVRALLAVLEMQGEYGKERMGTEVQRELAAMVRTIRNSKRNTPNIQPIDIEAIEAPGATNSAAQPVALRRQS